MLTLNYADSLSVYKVLLLFKPEIKTPERGHTEVLIQISRRTVLTHNPPLCLTQGYRGARAPVCHDHRSLKLVLF